MGQCGYNPGNSRANDEHVCEDGVCFSVRRIEPECKEISGSQDSLSGSQPGRVVDQMSVSQDLGQREIWTLGSISAQFSQVSISGRGRKRVCSPVIEEGVWFQVSCAGGFLVWLPFLMVLRV